MFIASCTCLLWHTFRLWHKLCLYLRHKLSPVTTYAANISIICRRRQFMPEILFVVDITGDNICCKKKITGIYCRSRSLFLSIFSIYCFLYLVNGSKGVLCYSYLYVNLCFKYKNKVIIEWRFISIFLVQDLNYQTYVNCFFKIGLPEKRFIVMKQNDFFHISHSIISVCFVKYRGILIKCEIKEYWALTLLYFI